MLHFFKSIRSIFCTYTLRNAMIFNECMLASPSFSRIVSSHAQAYHYIHVHHPHVFVIMHLCVVCWYATATFA